MMAKSIFLESPVNPSASIRTWSPLLSGPIKDRAWEAIHAIAQELPEPNEDMHGSFAGGSAGLATAFTYLAEAEPDKGHEERAMRYLDHAIDQLSSKFQMPGLYSGFIGIAWAVEHLQGRLLEAEGEDANSELDDALLQHLNARSLEDDYDLISGLAGFGLYGLTRAHRPSGYAIVEKLVRMLQDSAHETADGKTWFTSPNLLPQWQRDLYPAGYYNLGLAHGMPAVLAFLGGAIAKGVLVEIAQPLLEDSVRWMLAQENPSNSGSCFATVQLPDGPGSRERNPEGLKSRIAWCYGDLGLAFGLLHAARAVGRSDWEAEALRIARLSAQRPANDAGVRDPGLCHGAAGNAHLFNRLYQLSGDDVFADAARAYFQMTLEFRNPGQGYGGFQRWQLKEGSQTEFEFVTELAWLEGSSGILMALLAAVTDLEPAWDQFLMATLPA
jgi:lantibiotic biosynthesis protein